MQGQAIVVDLPGVKDQQEALDAVDVSGVVELRPVVEPARVRRPPSRPATSPTTTIASGTVPAASTPATTAPATRRPRTTAPATTAPAGFRMRLPAQTVPAPEPVATEPVDRRCCRPAPTATGAELLPTRDGASVCVGPAQGDR